MGEIELYQLSQSRVLTIFMLVLTPGLLPSPHDCLFIVPALHYPHSLQSSRCHERHVTDVMFVMSSRVISTRYILQQ